MFKMVELFREEHFEIEYIIIHSKDEYDFVKIKLKKRIKTILLSEFIS